MNIERIEAAVDRVKSARNELKEAEEYLGRLCGVGTDQPPLAFGPSAPTLKPNGHGRPPRGYREKLVDGLLHSRKQHIGTIADRGVQRAKADGYKLTVRQVKKAVWVAYADGRAAIDGRCHYKAVQK